MSSSSDNRYQCEACKRVRSVKVDLREHEKKVKLSSNGLVYYSDIHRCEDGILGINSVYLDHNCHIRSFSNLQLPTKRKPMKKSLPGLPSPMAKKKENDDPNRLEEFKLTNIISEKQLRIRILDYRLRVLIKIGEMDHRKEKMLTLIQSDLGTIDLEYYPSDVDFNTSMEKWLHIMVNLLEKLPPTTLGLFIENLQFIMAHYYDFPTPDSIKQLKTIITSHETYFILQLRDEQLHDKLRYIGAKYGDDIADMAKDLVTFLKENPMTPLRHYTRIHDRDLLFLINLFLILEQEGVVNIERPGMMDEQIDAEMSFSYSKYS